MADIGSILDLISTGVGAVDGAIKALKGVKELTKKEGTGLDHLAINKRLAEAIEQMIQTKEAQLALLQMAVSLQAEKVAFEKEKTNVDQFLSKRNQYILKEIAPHSYAYQRHGDASPQYACTHCFDNGKISLMQLQKRDFNFDTLQCHACGSTVQCKNDIKAEVLVVPRRRDDFLRSGWEGL